jgi:hypothetical protein
MGRTYPSEIKRILTAPGGDVGRECRSVALEIAVEAKRQALNVFGKHPGDRPRTGALANAYQVKVIPGSNTFVVINPKKYAAAMEKGAARHIIKPRKVNYLQFRGRDGRWNKVKLVRHPGSAARNTLLNSAKAVMQRRYGVS